MAKPVFVVTTLALLASAAAFGDDDREFEKRVAAEPNGVVEVSNVSGTVNIRGWDRAEVQVQAVMEEDVERIDVITEGKRTRVKVVLPRSSNRDIDGEAYLDIHVPHGSELDVSTVSAEIESNGITGRQRLKSVSGNVGADLAASD